MKIVTFQKKQVKVWFGSYLAAAVADTLSL